MRERLLELIKPLLGNEDDILSNGDRSLDSLKVLQIVMALDEAGFAIPMEQIADIQSVEDILTLAASAKP